jgi:hypothetical protein
VLRRIALKRRDASVDRLVLLVADTRHDREVVRAAQLELAAMLPAGRRRAMACLALGRDPGADALIWPDARPIDHLVVSTTAERPSALGIRSFGGRSRRGCARSTADPSFGACRRCVRRSF